jgi:hypothetical protein
MKQLFLTCLLALIAGSAGAQAQDNAPPPNSAQSLSTVQLDLKGALAVIAQLEAENAQLRGAKVYYGYNSETGTYTYRHLGAVPPSRPDCPQG